MTVKIFINGFGRIGRLVLRAISEYSRHNEFEVVGINHPRGAESAYYLYKYDSVHGIAHTPVTYTNDGLDVGFGKIPLVCSRDPSVLDLSDVDVVMECTGVYKTRADMQVFLDRGAKKILVSAPFKPADCTVVYGVNQDVITPVHTIVSNASCTTNCLAPVVKVLDDAFGIDRGYMTTIHAYTGDQQILDSSHKYNRRARAAGLSIVPTSSGAARAMQQVMPHMEGKLDGVAMRVPTPNVSCIDLKVDVYQSVTTDQVNTAMQKSANGALSGVLGYETEELVSIDFNHNPHSSIFDATQTMVLQGTSLRVVAWYDNEWGFSCRMLDTAKCMYGV